MGDQSDEEMTGGRGTGRGAGGGYALIATRRSWLVPSLSDVLSSLDLEVVQTRSAEETLARADSETPRLVLVDHDVVREDGAAELCRRLARERLPASVPLILYTSSTFARSDVRARALDAGAWSVLSEPLEAEPLLALVRRMLRLSELLTEARSQDSLVDPETGLLTLSGLRQVLPSLGALAVRNQAPVSVVVLSPTRSGESLNDVRRRTAELCSPNVRSADVCAWVNGDQLAVVAYDTPAEGARQLVRRLNATAEERESADESEALSAGIVELRPREGLEEAVDASRRARPGREEVSLPEFRNLFSLSIAQEALDRARESGGGVRVVGGL